MAEAVESKYLCAICNKAAGVFRCEGCQQLFCRKHSTEHSFALSKEMEHIIYHHDLLQQEIANENINIKEHSLVKKINEWEQESIVKIQITADKARRKFLEAFNDSKKAIQKKLEKVRVQLKASKEMDDYSEKDLNRWLQTLERLKNDLMEPHTVTLNKVNDRTWIQRLTVSTQLSEKFEALVGDIKMIENGLVTWHDDPAGHAHARGFKTYSTGVHRINLKIEKMFKNQWMFWGIISHGAILQKNSYASISAYGWTKHGYIISNGKRVSYEHDGNFIENDTIYLTLNCDQHMILLENDRTEKLYSINVDLINCPFPWQLNVCLHGSNDRLRILP
ncbi:hypothetical protein I4U23_004109 [Adineta vaga]|nr:hypothetical protein I4U23_004109 [Adineta vaga]